MQAVILAAGRGTRMGKLTEEIPKPMLPLLGKPMLEWKLAMLPKDITEIVFVVGYLREKIELYFQDVFRGKRIRYVTQENLDGTFGALRAAQSILEGKFLVTMGDDLYHPADLEDLIEENAAVLALHMDHAEDYGLIKISTTGTLQEIVERPHGRKRGLVNTAAYAMDSRIFDYRPVAVSEKEYGLPQTLALMSRDMPVTVLKARAWQPVGRPEDIPAGEEFLRTYFIGGAGKE